MYFDLTNWDFQPPKVTILSPNLRTILKDSQIPQNIDPIDNSKHIFSNQNGRSWFCSPGFFEYHDFYSVDPWELIRGTDDGCISWIVDRAIQLIDRSKFRDPQ